VHVGDVGRVDEAERHEVERGLDLQDLDQLAAIGEIDLRDRRRAVRIAARIHPDQAGLLRHREAGEADRGEVGVVPAGEGGDRRADAVGPELPAVERADEVAVDHAPGREGHAAVGAAVAQGEERPRLLAPEHHGLLAEAHGPHPPGPDAAALADAVPDVVERPADRIPCHACPAVPPHRPGSIPAGASP
jgi:hypothetical protein